MKDYVNKTNKKPYINIIRAIEKKDLFETSEISDEYLKYNSVKFVPASGAATRMFSHLYGFLDTNVKTKEVELFLDNIDKFAFFEDVINVINDFDDLGLVEYILKSGLNYGDLPKALIKMHTYDNFSTTPIDEHIYEAKEYLNKTNPRIHFTISPEHESIFNEYLKQVLVSNESIKVEYSLQDITTDTIVLDEFNNPYVLDNGEFLYRPAGHGALLKNLNNINADLIFIKNIDNVCHRSQIDDTIISKKRIASIGINLKAKIDEYIKNILYNGYIMEEIITFIQDVLKIDFKDLLDIKTALNILDRPLRICGVVENLGEIGGMPYMVEDGSIRSPQIVEASEVDLSLYGDIVNNSKYFNPVDMVCFVKDYNGKKYDLRKYVNHDRYMVVEKMYGGRIIKSIEYPGLWNGSMHYWNTVFVEIPISTFNPVKSVNDLLKAKHRGL